MSSFEVPALANNTETSITIDEPVALADEQLDEVAGSAAAVSIKPADLQQAASAAVEVATALKPPIGDPTTVGLLPPLHDIL